MAITRSKTLSKTDLLLWCNEAIVHAFERNLNTSNIAHIFDMTQHQVKWLMARWYEDSSIAPVPKPRYPCSAQQVHAQSTIAKKVAQNPIRRLHQGVWYLLDDR